MVGLGLLEFGISWVATGAIWVLDTTQHWEALSMFSL